jgi:peptide-methionine (R)-S-oxide reductase
MASRSCQETAMLDRRRLIALSALAAFGLRGNAHAAGKDEAFEVTRTEAEWRARLTAEQFYVLREHGTERPFTSPLDKEYRKGTFFCAGCDLPLFASETKYDSRTGWPSFHTPIADAVRTRVDRTFFMTRTEVHCRRCGGHLGHVFDDGPPPTGKRYCMNGVALTFRPAQGNS